MHRDRIATLRDHLRDNVLDKRFDLGSWVGCHSIPWGGTQDLSCGTTACAMGWAATIPSFQALGLKLAPLSSGAQFGQLYFEGKAHFDAAAKFMDISANLADYLFSLNQYEGHDSRLDVVNRLSEILDRTAVEDTHYDASEFE